MTRVALFADVQGNAVALEAILNHAQRHQPDTYVCLGDVASGAQPHQVIDLLRAWAVKSVRGNMDTVLLNPPAPEGTADDADLKFNEMDHWGAAQLTTQDRQWLQNLPMRLTFPLALGKGVSMLCVHGSPQDETDPLDHRTPESILAQWLQDIHDPILATGHMHLPMLRYFGEKILLNPGSVGLPYGGKRLMPTQAQYALIESQNVDVSIQFHTVAYDGQALRSAILNSGMPHAAWYLSQWIIR